MSDNKDKTPYNELWDLWKNWRLENKESLQWGFKRALLHWKMWKEDWTELHARMLNLVEETQVLQRQKEIIYKDSEAELTKLRDVLKWMVFAYINKDEDMPHDFEISALQDCADLGIPLAKEALAKYKKDV